MVSLINFFYKPATAVGLITIFIIGYIVYIDQSGGFDKVFTVLDYAGKPRTVSARRKVNG